METRRRDHELAQTLRAGHQWAVDCAAAGELKSALTVSDADPAVTTYVVKLLDVTPNVGKVKGRRLLHDLGIGEFVRICDLSSSQRSELLDAVAQRLSDAR